jgi:hypothetical protein
MHNAVRGTTALATTCLIMTAAPAKAADEGRMQIEVHGYHQQWAAFMDGQDLEDGAGQKPFDTNFIDQKHNSEVCFEGKYALDNEFTVGINVQIEANTNADQIDESYLFVETASFGRFIIGDENNAAYLLQVTAPHGGISHQQGTLTGQPDQGLVILPADFRSSDTVIDSTLLRFDDADSGKFSYFTPRLGGFQVGASYIPNFENGGDNNNSITRVDSAAGPGTNGANNGYAIGANFTETFGQFGLQASLGYLYGDIPPSSGGGGSSNLQAVSGGVQVAIAGFDIGGSYTWANGDRVAAGPNSYDGFSYDIGVTYSIGAYKIGLVYLTGETEGQRDNSSRQFADYVVLSATYAVGPGVKLIGGVYGFDLDGEDGEAGPGEVSSNEGFGGALGFTLSF